MWITPALIRPPTAKSVPIKRQNATRKAVIAQNRELVKVVSMETSIGFEPVEIFIAKPVSRCNMKYCAAHSIDA